MSDTQMFRLQPVTDATAGQRKTQTMKNQVRTRRVRVVVRANVTPDAAATTALNRGSVLAMFDSIGLLEGGNERIRADARVMGFLSAAFAEGVRQPDRLTDAEAAAGLAVDLEEVFDFVFATPRQIKPSETTYMERNTLLALQLFYDLRSDPVAALCDGGGTLNSLSITATQHYDGNLAEPPVFIPTVRLMASVNVPAANSELQIPVQTDRYVRALVLSQVGTNGELSDVINSAALYGDNRNFIGPSQVDFADLLAGQDLDLPGLPDSQGSHLFIDMTRDARLSTAFNPATDRNTRFTLNVEPTADAGGGSRVMVHALELERVPGLTAKAAFLGDR